MKETLDPVLFAAIAPMEADIKDDLEAVETILLSSRHQKRIADGQSIFASVLVQAIDM